MVALRPFSAAWLAASALDSSMLEGMYFSTCSSGTLRAYISGSRKL
jgi:hypothetical protein